MTPIQVVRVPRRPICSRMARVKLHSDTRALLRPALAPPAFLGTPQGWGEAAPHRFGPRHGPRPDSSDDPVEHPRLTGLSLATRRRRPNMRSARNPWNRSHTRDRASTFFLPALPLLRTVALRLSPPLLVALNCQPPVPRPVPQACRRCARPQGRPWRASLPVIVQSCSSTCLQLQNHH
jgi:hypothetical protein